jgi:predicted lysophospholipase L1 biosynthesis ABC-type transport system permease subunit
MKLVASAGFTPARAAGGVRGVLRPLRPDIGVRMALGATTADVLRLVVGNAVRVIATGAAIGLVLATIRGQLLASMLSASSPWTR